jgi:endonuclease G
VLKYHHYSVTVCRSRRLAFFTAVNIDGSLAKAPRREQDAWILDPRIGSDEQVPGGFYLNNDFDKGHLVRRLDPAWGDDDFIVKTANDDTFHYTNCSPQHKSFNQGATLWAGLEDYLLNGAKARGQKISVFTGPIFGSNDPSYRGVQVPLAFWKVVAFQNALGGIASGAFLVSQKNLVEDMLREAFTVSLFQVPIRQIARATGLDFGSLADFDPLNTQEAASPELHEAVGILSAGKTIGVWRDIQL